MHLELTQAEINLLAACVDQGRHTLRLEKTYRPASNVNYPKRLSELNQMYNRLKPLVNYDTQ